MNESSIQFHQVWKKFRKGEKYDSLRDAIPALVRGLFSGGRGTELEAMEFWALQDVSFDLRHGDVLGIIGPNGSGKSTTLKLLSGILRPDLGEVSVRGRLSALIELGAGFHPDLTGRENIFLNAAILGMKKAEIARKFDQIVEFSELEDFLETPVKRYSSGMYARLGFSVAAHVDPEILLLDEVLSVGDYHFQQKCFNKMTEFKKQGTAIVFVSHNLSAVSSICSRVLLLRKGEAVFQGDVPTGIRKYYEFYEHEILSSEVEIEHVVLRSQAGEERQVFQPGEKVAVEIRIRALSALRGVHASLMIHTLEGQFVFDTATSRLSGRRLDLTKGQSARLVFLLDMNLQNRVFLLGFNVKAPEDQDYLYYNPRLKRIVVSGEPISNGIVFLNPRLQVIAEGGTE